jgi:xanthine dehydrogenase accessory factor
VISSPPRLIVFGAVDQATALCELAHLAGWRAYVIDPRPGFATRTRFPNAMQVVADWPARAVERLGGIDREASIVVFTHDRRLDHEALAVSLDSDAAYVGAMGARHTRPVCREGLLQAGFTSRELERLHTPIGLNIGAVTPPEIALAILVDVIAARRDCGCARRGDPSQRMSVW